MADSAVSKVRCCCRANTPSSSSTRWSADPHSAAHLHWAAAASANGAVLAPIHCGVRRIRVGRFWGRGALRSPLAVGLDCLCANDAYQHHAGNRVLNTQWQGLGPG